MKEKMKSNNALKIAVIGGGASGLTAAIFAAREAKKIGKNVKVTVYEGNSRIGKKILVTGNGRCNFTNENISSVNYHGETALAQSICEKFTNEDVKEFFCSLGLFSKSDFAGRVYPMSNQATAVLDALRFELIRLGIEEVTDTKIVSLKKDSHGFILNERYHCDKCIIATGGKAAPVQGSDGSGFILLKDFGIEVSSLLPALTPIVCEDFTKSLKGIRAQGKISIKCGGKLLSEDTGEIQYTDYGLSGIPSMQVSRFVSGTLNVNKTDVFAFVDSCPFFTADELKSALLTIIKNNPSLPGEMLLSGIMPKRLGMTLLSECSVNPSKNIGIIHDAVLDRIVSAVKNKKYKVTAVKGFNDAQVTSGGIVGKEINFDTLELKKVKGIYVCGEIVDVDGDCGGYNLQWAWSSGAAAGINSVRGFDKCFV
ncbi:MAG: aminoacetone oxidase family FAD-binding enzyme [Clostridia bacterium]|nr:aminoacetone oxidase family FAD-binding enzyme [Clostridia bacterium]